MKLNLLLLFLITINLSFSQSYFSWKPINLSGAQLYNLVYKGSKLDSVIFSRSFYDDEIMYQSKKLIAEEWNGNDNPTEAMSYERYDTISSWEPSKRFEYEFDTLNRIINYIEWHSIKYSFEYDIYNRVTKEIHYRWNSNNSDWDIKYYEEKDIKGRPLLDYSYNYYGNTIESGYRKSYQYLDEPNIIYEYNQTIDTSSLEWVYSSKSIYNFENGRKSTWKWYFWNVDSKKWEEELYKRYFYKDQNLSEELSYKWNTTNNVWVKNLKYIYYYTNNNVTRMENFGWEGSSWSWVLSYINYCYDINQNLIKKENYKLYKSDYKLTIKEEYAYRQNDLISNSIIYYNELNDSMLYGSVYSTIFESGNKEINTNQFWDVDLYDWVNYSKTTLVFNEDESPTYYSYENWDRESSSWKKRNESKFYWSKFNGHIPIVIQPSDIIDSNIKNIVLNYPNPYTNSDFITCNSGSLTDVVIIDLYRITGSLVQRINCKNNEVARFINLAPAVYILVAHLNNQIIKTDKLIVY